MHISVALNLDQRYGPEYRIVMHAIINSIGHLVLPNASPTWAHDIAALLAKRGKPMTRRNAFLVAYRSGVPLAFTDVMIVLTLDEERAWHSDAGVRRTVRNHAGKLASDFARCECDIVTGEGRFVETVSS